MTHGRFSSSTDPLTDNPNPLADLDDHDDLFDDNDTASQRSIPLSSPPTSPKTEPAAFTSSPTSMSPTSSDVFVRAFELDVSPKSGPPSAYTPDKAAPSKKAQRESMLLHPLTGPLILGIALVDFNHIVGPRIEFYEGEIFEDEEIAKILPFLALPDGAHLSSEDYTYFHVVPTSPNPTTVFGISCNRQIAASALLVKDVDVTRSTVQKAVVVLASMPLFGPIRDRLGVVTLALFEQRDFSNLQILTDLYKSLELSLKSHLTTSGLYMGTSLRDLVHVFRQRTLILLKALILQKRIMFYGHPLERLCTYQYSLVTLMPGLLQNLEDCGSPPLATRASSLTPPTSLKTSDHRSMLAYLGLPLDLFGKDAFFQPYLPLQQLDMIKESKSWLCGTTNSIVGQQKEVDLYVDTETGTVEFRDPTLEKSTGLTSADRRWMDAIIKDVNDGWDEEERRTQFRGSDDYLRQKFEEYISGVLASIKHADFIAKGKANDVVITEGGENNTAIQDYNPLWVSELRRTNAYEVWERVTDPLLFDITEPRHPCAGMTSVVGDIGLRFQEGVQQLTPARDAISRSLVTGSTNFFKAVGGVRGRFMSRTSSAGGPATPPESGRGTPEFGKDSDTVSIKSTASSNNPPVIQKTPPLPPQTASPQVVAPEFTASQRTATPFGGWGSGIGSFFSSKASRFSLGGETVMSPPPIPTTATPIVAHEPKELDDIPEHFAPRDLDAEREEVEREEVEKETLAAGQQQT